MADPLARTTQDLPEIIYGTAFKFDKSKILVEAALNAGFRAIDTSGSKAAYRENLVGEGIAAAMATGKFQRSDIYIQTKFSPHKPGKDPALYPYDCTKSIPEQVAQSIESSLVNLGVTYIDSLVLHSLYADIEDTLVAWKAMEALVPSKVKSIGLSNADLESIRKVYETATIKPIAVQNRFVIDTVDRPNPKFPAELPNPIVPWDRDVREYCLRHGIAYAPWGMLWGSLDELDSPDLVLTKAGKELGFSREIACYALMRSLGGCQITLLCGTSSEIHLRETLAGLSKVKKYIEESEENAKKWQGLVASLKAIVDDA